MPKETVKEIDERNQLEELAPIKPEEQKYADWGLSVLSADQKARMLEVSPFDVLQIVRGYQTYKPRKEETEKAFKMIQDWRDTVAYANIFDVPHPDAELFHRSLWQENVYGVDGFGHLIISFTFQDVNVNAIGEMDGDTLAAIIAQKLASYTWLKAKNAAASGKQRYKATFVVDMNGAGASVFSGKRRGVVKKVMDFGSDYFPESVWKIYVVNTPFLLRGGYAIARPWIHPVTQAKINIVNDPASAYKLMVENDRATHDQIPVGLGGGHEGTNCLDIIHQAIADTKAAKAAGGAPGGGAARQTPPGTLL